MGIPVARMKLLVAALEKAGNAEAAALVAELLWFTELEAKYRLDLPADKNIHRKKSCTGKDKLEEPQAVQRAIELNRGLSSWMKHYASYPCLYCGSWHVGTDNPDRRRYRIDKPMTDMEQNFERVWLEVQKPEWLVEDPQSRIGELGSLLVMLFEEFGWEVPEKPGRARKMIEIFKAEFVDEEEAGDGDEEVSGGSVAA